ncbi:transposase, partial [Fusarium albosuccineum]
MNPIDPSLRFPDDILPPEKQYNSREEVYAAINDWASTRGYAFSVGRSRKTANGRVLVTYSCDRGAGRTPTPKPAKDRKRDTSTRRTGCLFSVIAKESLCGATWSLRHHPGVQFGQHDHKRSISPLAHPSLRKLSRQDGSTVQQLTNAGIAPKEVTSYMRTNSDSRQSNMHALADQLKGEGFWSQIRLDEGGRVTSVLFAHPKSLGYLKSYPEVLILDCTYKTNKHKMHLLDVVGVDACQRSFCIAFAFLTGEEEDDYIWALARLRQVTSFVRDEANDQGIEAWEDFYKSWHEIVASPTEDTYNERLEKFKQRYTPDHINEVGYIIETWLQLCKKRFVKAWVNQYLRFGQLVTSRCEGIHQLLQSHLKTSQADLFEAWRIIKLVLVNQLAELEGNQANEHMHCALGRSIAGSSSNLYSNTDHNTLNYLLRDPLAIPIRVLCGIRDHSLSATAAASGAREKSPLSADHALIIFQRYEEARETWYATLAKRGEKTNRAYREAMKLPLEYDEKDYEWCRDYKQMGKDCTEEGSREWREEEMMSYLNWDQAEQRRAEESVLKERAGQPFTSY